MNEQRISTFFENDHREIDAILTSVPFERGAQALPEFESFDRRLERHIQWEEEILFPAVGAKAPPLEAGPLRVMRHEHVLIRREKAAALEALRRGDGAKAAAHTRAMLEVLKDHNGKEEQILYPACDEMLDAAEVARVFERLQIAAR